MVFLIFIFKLDYQSGECTQHIEIYKLNYILLLLFSLLSIVSKQLILFSPKLEIICIKMKEIG